MDPRRATQPSANVLRVATYNIHKGVRGIGPRKRLEIHNLEQGVASLKADVLMLQEVRLFHHREARRFAHGPQAWPQQGQAEFLAPEGFHCVYRTNAVTRHGEHGNALLCRWPVGDVGHHDVSDHRFEQRGLLHVPFAWAGTTMHAVVAHFGLMHASRVRQAERVLELIEREVPAHDPVIVGGDFNDWGEKLDPLFERDGLRRARMPEGIGLRGPGVPAAAAPLPTFPSRIPVFALDRFYTRGLRCRAVQVPRGLSWAQLSDHLPLVAEFERH
ncbi:MAG: endonuclease [Betaproteobacteria bacterium]|nr:endonuclease [Betaproteobacteria bacterium]